MWWPKRLTTFREEGDSCLLRRISGCSQEGSEFEGEKIARKGLSPEKVARAVGEKVK
jgi:hypothetical protein